MKTLRKLTIVSTLACMLLGLIFNWLMIREYGRFIIQSKLLIGVLIVLEIIVLLSAINNKTLIKAYYIGLPIMVYISIFSCYLVCIPIIGFTNSIMQVLSVSTFISLTVISYIRRIILINDKYIKSIKAGIHSKYIQKDIILNLLITIIVLVLLKTLNSNRDLKIIWV